MSMDGKYSRAFVVGLAFGVLLTCLNMWAYLGYQQQMDEYWASEKSMYVGNMCVGIDTYFYLIILTAAIYIAIGISSVQYAWKYLEDRIDADRVASLTGLVAAVVSVPTSLLLIVSGIFTTGASYSGWILIYGLYAIGGICVAMIAGINYYRFLRHRIRAKK